MKRYALSLLAIGLASSLLGCSQKAFMQPEPQPSPQVTMKVVSAQPVSQQPLLPEAQEKQEEKQLTLLAVGDIMVHQEQLEAAWDPKKKVYDFAPFFAKVAPVLKQGDLVLGNLETTLAGSKSGYTGYPQFNSPESLATVLKQVGFSAVTTANNHSLDRREAGVLATIAHLDQAGLPHTGTFRSAEERNQPLFLEKNGIKLALLSYTYGTNGIPIPKGKPYLVNLIQPALIKQDVTRAKLMGADLVAVALHFGNEYQRMPSQFQKNMADVSIQAGADLIIGHHPHVVQPYEWRTVTMADGSKRTGFVAYSLGNFISAQRRDYKDVGAILKLDIRKQTDGKTIIKQSEIIPTYVHYYRKAGKRNYVIYPLPQTLQANAPRDPQINAETYRHMQRIYQEMIKHVTSFSGQKKTG